MSSRLIVIALAISLAADELAFAQQALPPEGTQVLKSSQDATNAPESAWLDLRQSNPTHSKVQAAPPWVESDSFSAADSRSAGAAKSVFRLRLVRPNEDCQLLLFRLYYDDLPGEQPELIAWDESGSQLLRSGPLGRGGGLATSSSTVVPMIGVSAVDIEVPGNGRSIRGAYLDWMKSSKVMRPIHAAQGKLLADPFSGPTPLQTSEDDKEIYGTVTAPLANETVAMGSSRESAATFQFGLEAQPLVALLAFEVASPQIEAPPEIYVNGEDIGPAALILPDLADPAYRGLSLSLLQTMKFQYTGWVRAQKIVPASLLKAGTNDVMILAGTGTSTSAVRQTQIQLKYLWDKSDYLLEPLK